VRHIILLFLGEGVPPISEFISEFDFPGHTHSMPHTEYFPGDEATRFGIWSTWLQCKRPVEVLVCAGKLTPYRMLGPKGSPSAANLTSILTALQKTEGVLFELALKRVSPLPAG
jgi:hypothetical protein